VPRVAIVIAKAGALFVFAQMAIVACAHANGADAVQQFRQGRHVLMIRHASAPGNGDPADFRLDKCDTQRNLDDDGRAQARAIGRWLKARGVTRAQIYSSQWCRCLETARLLGLGDPVELPALNSFYQQVEDREPNLRALREFLDSRATTDSPVVLVTHQVTITALTGVYPASGEGVLIDRADAQQRYAAKARLLFEE
jgi:broad specificity phosphatase PhoE